MVDEKVKFEISKLVKGRNKQWVTARELWNDINSQYVFAHLQGSRALGLYLANELKLASRRRDKTEVLEFYCV